MRLSDMVAVEQPIQKYGDGGVGILESDVIKRSSSLPSR